MGTITKKEVKSSSKIEEKSPPMYKVILHNDDYTTMDFVVDLLRTVFRKGHQEAEQITFEVHTKGKAIAGVYTREIAETKVEIVHLQAAAKEFPLRASMEEE